MDALNEILDSIKRGERIIIRPVNKSSEEITLELLARLSGLDIGRIEKGFLSRSEWPKLTEAASELYGLNIRFSNEPIKVLEV